MSDPVLPLGDVRFYDNYLPLLDAGDYQLVIQQLINSSDATHPLSEKAPDPPLTQAFSVVAPRFALASTEVQSMFPASNASGAFGQNLPHVVLMQRALPWERELAIKGQNLPPPANPKVETYPWMALLLFTEDEIMAPANVPPQSAMANPTKVGTYAAAQIRTPTEANILGSNVPPEREDETSGRAIDITTDVFTKITPRLADLPYLAHARQVNVDQKTTSLALTNGWFGVVIGNRFPATSKAGTRNIAHLVSLEGFGPYLTDNPTWPSGITAVRLCSLVSWAFTATTDVADFAGLMGHLVAGQSPGGDGLRLSLPVPATPPPPPLTPAGDPAPQMQQAQQALKQGYAALEYETRFGEQTFAWYHGPLVPHPLAPLTVGTAFPSSAAATVYDSDSGTFDLSYAAAWEVGRLLALSDRAYGTNQQRVRKSLRKVVNLVRERTRWANGAQAAAATGDLTALMHPRQVSRSFGQWLGGDAAAHIPHPRRAAAAVPRAARQQPAPRPQAVEELRALHARADVQALVSAHVERAATDGGPGEDVVNWLGQLRQFIGVPFVHLVPDARMLPAESIRFFYVDHNALDALCDGAQSVGVQTTRDALQQQLVRGTMRAAAIRRGQAHRKMLIARARGATKAAALSAAMATQTPADPVAGFLLRSAVVSDWPGLEVKAFSDIGGDDSTLIDPIRLEHVAGDVLLALYPKVPARIDIEEPKEGLAFGVEDEQKVALRSVVGDNIGSELGTDITLATTYLRANNVLHVDAWQTYVAQQLAQAQSGSAAVWGPAAFALQMVRLPERMTFTNG
jgi:hypothetical protein